MQFDFLKTPTIFVLVSSGYVCGLSTLIGFAISRAMKSAQSNSAKNYWLVFSMANALLCGMAPTFLLAILAFAQSDRIAQRSLFFVVSLLAGATVSIYLSWQGDAKHANRKNETPES